MAKLSGIEIYKQLPRTNCGDCGVPTCMAFAMQVASQKVALDACPHVTDDARQALGDAQTPPMATVNIGIGDAALMLGGETVMHRHEERFQHPPLLAVRVSASLSSSAITERIRQIDALRFERVGRTIGVDGVAISADGVDADQYASAVRRIADLTALHLLLLCEDSAVLGPALEHVPERRPLLVAATSQNADAIQVLAKQHDLPVVVRGSALGATSGEALEPTIALAEQLIEAGLADLILAPPARSTSEAIGNLTLLRRMALEERVRGAGFPTYVDVADILGEKPAGSINPNERSVDEMVAGISLVLRYAGVLVIDTLEAWAVHPIATARQDIYTDPQVPNAVEAKLYEIGKPDSNSPVLVTTNFALTFFTVAGEVANSKASAYVSVIDTEGMGVLNASADNRLTVEGLVDVVRKQGAMDRVDHNQLIIPGLVARMRMGIEEASGWDVVVGPENASSIPAFLRERQGESRFEQEGSA